MDVLQIGGRLLLGFILGAVIGLEREVNEKKVSPPSQKPTAILGLRSFSLTSVLGVIVGFIYLKFASLALVLGSAFLALLLIFYFIDSKTTKDHGLTTELAAIYSFVIGILIAINVFPIQLILAVTIVVILLLSQKERIKGAVEDVKRTELNAFISYAILAAVIMPFLPNVDYSLSDLGGVTVFLKNIGLPIGRFTQIDLVNPFKIWLILVLVTGVDLVSYILGRIVGEKRGWFVASAIGGFVSSTATTQSIAQESRSTTQTNYLVASALLANLTSFFQIAFLIGLINAVFIGKIATVVLLMILTSAVLVSYFIKKKEGKKFTRSRSLKSEIPIIDIPFGLKFAGLYLTVSIVSKFALALFGRSGFLLATGVGALIGLDAVMISTAQLAATKISLELGVMAFIFANSVNLASKAIYSFIMGSKKFSSSFTLSVILIIAASILGFFLVI